MGYRQAGGDLSVKLQMIKKLVEECKSIADEHEMPFSINITDRWNGGVTYNPKVVIYRADPTDPDDTDEIEDGYWYWQASSMNC